MNVEELYLIIKERKKTMPKRSYVASLIRQGEGAILQKIGEEATEIIIASNGSSRQRIIEETADLYFMTLILLTYKNIPLDKIFAEFEKRRKRLTDRS